MINHDWYASGTNRNGKAFYRLFYNKPVFIYYCLCVTGEIQINNIVTSEDKDLTLDCSRVQLRCATLIYYAYIRRVVANHW